MQENQMNYLENEIDLRELFKTIVQNKIKIAAITAAITIAASIYVYFKNPIPIYSGQVMVEIGVVKAENVALQKFDNTNDLKALIEKQFNVTVDLPGRTSSIINISSSSTNKKIISENINAATKFIFDRHEETAKLYDKYIMTKQIGEIEVGNNPINSPKKKLIVVVAFVTGLILSIFMIFFLEFIKSTRKDQEN